MDFDSRINKILNEDEDLEKKIMALRCEVSDVEVRILDHMLIERLVRENEELEKEIGMYREELIALEKRNRRIQEFNICQRIMGERVNVSLCENKKSLKPEVTKPSSKSVSKEINQGSDKKAKKDSKKAEKAENKKLDGSGTAKTEADDLPVDISRLNLKVGKILQIEKHPDADSLYVEKVDIGKGDPITVVSGLVKHIPASEMLDSMVIILCNLKPAKMRGITSEGMVMCASTELKIEVLRPPAGSVPGDVIICPGYGTNPDVVLNPKKKVFETVASDLITDDEMLATFRGVRWIVENKGFVQAQTLKRANIK